MAQAGAGSGSQNFGAPSDGRVEQRRVLGRGRGRPLRRVDERVELQQEVVPRLNTGVYNAVMRGDTEAVKQALYKDKINRGDEVPEYFTDYESMMAATSYVDSPVTVSTPAYKPTPKKAATKTNGYCLFIRHRGRETGTDGSINELMGIFDKDWKSLSEDDKKMWKERAKTGWKPDFRQYGANKGRGTTAAPKPVKEEKDYDTGEEEDVFY